MNNMDINLWNMWICIYIYTHVRVYIYIHTVPIICDVPSIFIWIYKSILLTCLFLVPINFASGTGNLAGSQWPFAFCDKYNNLIGYKRSCIVEIILANSGFVMLLMSSDDPSHSEYRPPGFILNTNLQGLKLVYIHYTSVLGK